MANAGARTVAAVDLNSFVLAKQIGLDGAPGSVLANPLRPGVYVLVPESGTVCEIDAAKLAVVRKTSLGDTALGMRMAADGKSLWVLKARALARLELTLLRAAEEIRLPSAATDFDLTGDGRAAVCFGADRRLALVRLGTGKVEHLIDAECEPSLVRFQGDGQAGAGGKPGGPVSVDLRRGQWADRGAAAAAGRTCELLLQFRRRPDVS